MSSKILHQPLQYTYSQSFRKIYSDNEIERNYALFSQRQSPNQIFLQYEKVDNQAIYPKPSKNINIFKNTANNASPVKRLHHNTKKISFSVFVKQSRKKQMQRKSQAHSLSYNQRVESKKMKGSRRINQVIRKIYENFRKTQNSSTKSQKKNSQQNSLIETKNPDVKPYTSQVKSRTKSLNQSTINRLKQHNQQATTSRTKINFFKTLSFGQKHSHSKELQNFRSHENSKGFIHIGAKTEVDPVNFQENGEEAPCFLKIEKCSLQKKDQSFIKHCMDIKQMLLKDRLEKQNKKKANELMKSPYLQSEFYQIISNKSQNKYVSEMREVKKIKKTKIKLEQQDSSKNKIQPW